MAPSPYTISIGRHAVVRGLLAAPHGIVMIGDGARLQGAVAGFDIITGVGLRVEWESGFTATVSGTQRLHGYFDRRGRPADCVPVMGPASCGHDHLVWRSAYRSGNAKELSAFLRQVSDPEKCQFSSVHRRRGFRFVRPMGRPLRTITSGIEADWALLQLAWNGDRSDSSK